MLFQMVAAPKGLGAYFARIRTQTRVDALVARQLLVARERFAAAGIVALKGSLA